MKKPRIPHCLLIALALASIPCVSAQNGLPASQPKRLTIVREDVKVGLGADHAKNEAGWPAAYEKAKSPNYYIALTSMTGPSTALYLVPFDSFAAEAESMKREDKDPVLSAELSRLSLRDAEFISNATVVQTVARTDLSVGKFPDVAKARFFEISTFTVRQSQTQNFDAVMKAYGAARKRVAPDTSYRVYAVDAGMPAPTYFIIQSVQDYAQFDQVNADHLKTLSSPAPEEKAIFDKWGDIVSRGETQRYRVDPVQSYVSKEVRASDPDFWSPK